MPRSSNNSRSAQAQSGPASVAAIRAMSVYDLRYACRTAGVPHQGTRATLVNRLIEQHGLAEEPRQDEESPSTASSSSTTPTTQPNSSRDVSLSAEIQAEIRRAVSSAFADMAPVLPQLTGNSTSPVPQRPTTNEALSFSAMNEPAPSASTSEANVQSATQSLASSFSSGPVSAATVPKRTVDRILRGEFVEFDDLLADSSFTHPDSESLEVFSTADGLSFRQSGRRRSKRRVEDLTSWLEAWTNYCGILVSLAPHRCRELFAYQAIIATAARQFFPEAWLAYDRQFRAAAAADASIKWDAIAPTIWQLTMTGKARPSCPNCHVHHSGRCLFRNDGSFRPSTSRVIEPRHSDGRVICRNYNQQRCNNRRCSRAHICLVCGGKHPSATNHPTSHASGAGSQPTQK